MKIAKTELLSLFLTLLLLLLAGYIYLTHGQTSQALTKTASKTVQTTAKSSKSNILVTTLNEKLAEIEKNPTVEALNALKTDIDKLKASTERDAILSKYNALMHEAEAIEQAEQALKAAESHPTQEAINHAQELINSLATETKKQEFTARLAGLTPISEQSSSSEHVTSDSETTTEETETHAATRGYTAPVTNAASSQATTPVTTPTSSTTNSASSEPTSEPIEVVDAPTTSDDN